MTTVPAHAKMSFNAFYDFIRAQALIVDRNNKENKNKNAKNNGNGRNKSCQANKQQQQCQQTKYDTADLEGFEYDYKSDAE